jgi:hypothetical protein
MPNRALVRPRRGLQPPSHVSHHDWPADVLIIMSSLDAAKPAADNRRLRPRQAYRVSALLTLFSDPAEIGPRRLYTRDATTRSLGFICTERLPIGHGGYVELVDPRGKLLRIPCMLHRCRETVPGWYEGAISFNREQFSFG